MKCDCGRVFSVYDLWELAAREGAACRTATIRAIGRPLKFWGAWLGWVGRWLDPDDLPTYWDVDLAPPVVETPPPGS